MSPMARRPPANSRDVRQWDVTVKNVSVNFIPGQLWPIYASARWILLQKRTKQRNPFARYPATWSHYKLTCRFVREGFISYYKMNGLKWSWDAGMHLNHRRHAKWSLAAWGGPQRSGVFYGYKLLCFNCGICFLGLMLFFCYICVHRICLKVICGSLMTPFINGTNISSQQTLAAQVLSFRPNRFFTLPL